MARSGRGTQARLPLLLSAAVVAALSSAPNFAGPLWVRARCPLEELCHPLVTSALLPLKAASGQASRARLALRAHHGRPKRTNPKARKRRARLQKEEAKKERKEVVMKRKGQRPRKPTAVKSGARAEAKSALDLPAEASHLLHGRWSGHGGQAAKLQLKLQGYQVVNHIQREKESLSREVGMLDKKIQTIEQDNRKAKLHREKQLAEQMESWKAKVREDALEAAGRKAPDGCCEQFGGIEISWESTPATCSILPDAQKFLRLREQTGILAAIDGEDVHRKSRTEVLKLFAKFQGSIEVLPPESIFASMWLSAHQALEGESLPDLECAEGSDWLAGMRLAWTKPPVVRELSAESMRHFPGLTVGDHLLEVDGTEVPGLTRGQILELLADLKGDMRLLPKGSFRLWLIQKDARKALQSGPEEDPESQGSGGCDWCGGILIAWAAPPFVRDITPEAHAAFSEPVHPGDVLTQVDDADVRGMGRKATLELLAAMKQSITFMAASRHRFMQSVALRAPEDEESWIGGLLIHWTSPPVVKEVYPEFQGFYEQPVSQGDRLASVHGTDVEGMDRAAILGLLSIYPESFSLRFLTAHLLRMHEDAAMALERGKKRHPKFREGHNWIGGVQLLWTIPPQVLQVKKEAEAIFPDALPGNYLALVDDQNIFVGMRTRREILQNLKRCKSVAFLDGERLAGYAAIAKQVLGDLMEALTGGDFQAADE
ncbi:unnamed protein product [Symbiodinium natans]|uniref:PDZ domain-containing protein n=1 Tax=Symbiodinium natans TaxID=878477 RepID=A0A812P5I0_9DINO|nr:unnamed protein product [Symbiodinium natans]